MALEIVSETKTITVKSTRLPGSCWRLIHDGKKVLKPFKGNGKTSTPHELYAGTKEECLAEIKRLGSGVF